MPPRSPGDKHSVQRNTEHLEEAGKVTWEGLSFSRRSHGNFWKRVQLKKSGGGWVHQGDPPCRGHGTGRLGSKGAHHLEPRGRDEESAQVREPALDDQGPLQT